MVLAWISKEGDGEQQQQRCGSIVWELSELHETMAVSGFVGGAGAEPPGLHLGWKPEVCQEMEARRGNGSQSWIPVPHDLDEVLL